MQYWDVAPGKCRLGRLNDGLPCLVALIVGVHNQRCQCRTYPALFEEGVCFVPGSLVSVTCMPSFTDSCRLGLFTDRKAAGLMDTVIRPNIVVCTSRSPRPVSITACVLSYTGLWLKVGAAKLTAKLEYDGHCDHGRISMSPCEHHDMAQHTTAWHCTAWPTTA